MSVSSPCVRKHHEGCQAADTCQCYCHRPKGGTPTGSTKRRPTIELAWEDPPDPKRRRSAVEGLKPLMIELRRKPDCWARLATYRSHNGASAMLHAARELAPDIEFTTRRLDDGGSALYGRFTEDDD